MDNSRRRYWRGIRAVKMTTYENDFNGGENFAGKIARILYYGGNVSSTDALKNECYLYGKYGI